MRSVHRASRAHGIFIIVHIYGWHFKQNVLPNSILGVLVTGQAHFAGLSKFIQGKQSDQQGLFTNLTYVMNSLMNMKGCSSNNINRNLIQ